MTNQHPITPPPELVEQWFDKANTKETMADVKEAFANSASQWGADQELEACCEWTQGYAECGDSLRAARRPKPPSLKEEALKGFDTIADIVLEEYSGTRFYEKYKKIADTTRRALEALPE
jgi:hypothetical protein